MAVFSTGSSTVSASVGGRTWSFYCYKPTGTITGLLMVFHGSSRDASGYRDSAKDFADYKKYLVVTPLFTEAAFPSDSYQRGNIDGNESNPSVWTTRYVGPMIDWARTKEEKPSLKTICYGFSAGGQFLSRVAAYDWPEQTSGIVVGSPSTHVRASGVDQNDGCPIDLDVSNDYSPYGFDTTFSSFGRYDGLKAYLKRPITIYVGTSDTSTTDNLGDENNDLGQGTNRLTRARFVFTEAQQNAAALGSNLGGSFGWKKVEAQGVGHSNGGMMRAEEMEAACEFGAVTPPPPPPDEFEPIVCADLSDDVFIKFNNGTVPSDMTAYRNQWCARLVDAINQFREERWGQSGFPQDPNNAYVAYQTADISDATFVAFNNNTAPADMTAYRTQWGARLRNGINQFHREEHGSA